MKTATTQTCTKCGEEKELTEYYFRKARGYHAKQCKACVQAVNAVWMSKNSDRAKEKALEYRRKHADYNREYARKYRSSEHGRKVRSAHSAEYQRRPEVAERRRKQGRENYRKKALNSEFRAKKAEWMRQYRKDNQEMFKQIHNAKARRRRAIESDKHTVPELHAYWRANGIDPKRCTYCDAWHTKWKNNWKTSAGDHVVPLAKGGKDVLENMMPCCVTCNSSKGARILGEEWIAPKDR